MILAIQIVGLVVLAHEATARVYAEVAQIINKRRLRNG